MRLRAVMVVLAVATLALAGCTADTTPDPQPVPTSTARPPHPPAPEPADPLDLADLAAYSGVAAMNAGSNCSGTLIDTGVAHGPAYILTNGHCAGDIGRGAQRTTLGEEWFGDAEFFRAEGNLANTLTVDVVQIAYSTMRLTDTAVLRLDATLGDLEDLGVRPVAISPEEPAPGSDVVNVGIPVQNLVDDEWVMRKGACTLGEQHTVIEFLWLWQNVWSNDCPGIIQGSSGSPLFATDDDGPTAIVGMINTTSAGVSREMGGACWMNRPCQVDGGVTELVPETAYAQLVAGIGACFDGATGEFALSADCPPPVSDVWAEDSGTGRFRGGGEPDVADRPAQARLVGRTAGVVRTALVPIGDATGCSQDATYAGAVAQALPAAEENSIWDTTLGLVVPVDLPTDEGFYLLCAVSGDDYAGAASVLFEVDRTAPVGEAGASVERHDGSVLVTPYFDPPEITTARFLWGPPGTSCEDPAEFTDFFMAPLHLTADELPAVYCVYGQDMAGNRTPVAKIDIPRG